MINSDCRYRLVGVLLILLLASLCASAQRSSMPAAAKVESKAGAITGRVVNENGQPHVNIEVVVRPDTPEGVPVTRIATNRDGSFKVSGLERGSYYVSAAVPAHIPKSPEAGPVVFTAGDPVTLVLIKGGVVTGTVTDTKGDPVAGIGVRVRMVSDESGRKYGDSGRYYDNMTDDRGVYRVYGLPTGTYVVSADGSIEDRPSLRIYVKGFANDLPTYAPSSNREGANEISVRVGEEVSDVNIRYRGERGSTISGIVNGIYDDHRMNVTLSSIVEGGPRWYNQAQGPGREFIFEAIPDGEYQLVAAASASDHTLRQSESMFLNVRGGADIEGIQLTIYPVASINGTVVLEPLKTPPPECTDKRPTRFSEMPVTAWQRITEGPRKKPQIVVRAGRPAIPNAEGKITLSNLAAGEYYFTMRFSTQQWFLQSIAFAPPTPGGIPIDATSTWTTVKPGDQLSGLTVTLAQGAGLVNGQISVAEGQVLPEKLVAFLVPAEVEKAGAVLRYYAVPVNSEGRFWASVAPGRYWILTKPGTDDTRIEGNKLRLPDGAQTRFALREAAEATKTEIEVKPCQKVTFKLPL